jgi:hypothetical protein
MTSATAAWLGSPLDHGHVGPAEMVRALYSDTFTPDRRCVVFGRDRTCIWCTTPQTVEDAAHRLDLTTDVYFGACLQDAAAERRGERGSAATVTVVPGTWADIDIAGPGKKKIHAPSVDQVVAHLASRIEQRPSIALLTGGGLHLWWLFDEPMIISNEAERREAAELAQRWQARLRSVLAEKCWELDSTHDLARVLRLPGTHNHKDEHRPPFPVHVVTWEVA